MLLWWRRIWKHILILLVDQPKKKKDTNRGWELTTILIKRNIWKTSIMMGYLRPWKLKICTRLKVVNRIKAMSLINFNWFSPRRYIQILFSGHPTDSYWVVGHSHISNRIINRKYIAEVWSVLLRHWNKSLWQKRAQKEEILHRLRSHLCNSIREARVR